ncbi:MAG: DNA polymerase III subunit chi [Polaromonas sp.]
MTKIDFHVNVADKLAYSCRLLRKAYQSGARIVVMGDAEMLAELDTRLWTFSPQDFVPHCRADAASATLTVTPIILTGSLADCAHHDVLVNLGLEVAVGFERFARLIDVANQMPQDLAAARQRWKHYQALGHAPKKHELVPAGVPI